MWATHGLMLTNGGYVKVIGITGGVGSGKTKILTFLKENYKCEIIVSDELAKDLCKKGEPCFKPLVDLLGKDVLSKDGEIDKALMAQKIFNEKSLLEKVNGIIHPAVRVFIEEEIETLKKENALDYLFIEAALLIECGYKEIVDEMWYIYTDIEVRRKRLKESRGYSDAKIDSILKSQLSDSEYRKNCDFEIDNSGLCEDSFEQIRERLGEYS